MAKSYSAGLALNLWMNGPLILSMLDAAVLHRLKGVGDLHHLARGGFRIGKGAISDAFLAATLALRLRSSTAFGAVVRKLDPFTPHASTSQRPTEV